MTIIKPFAGFRFDAKLAGELVDLIAPPYDIINPELRKALFDRSPFNVVRLILNEPEPTDNERRNRYTRAAELWRDWRHSGVLRRDAAPRLYRYNVSFHLKTPQGIVTRERPGFVALLQLHEYAAGKVRPHERTLAGPKQDRLQLMLATRAQLSQVFMLYPDPKGKLDGLLGAAPPAGAESWSAEDDAGVTHTMWGIEDPKTIAAVNDHLEQTPIYIADGHHRYETALAVRKHLRETVMFYFTPAEHPGLTIFPYHRLIHHLP